MQEDDHDMRLKDKVALVTGASRGIGHASCLALAKEGATIVGTARNHKDLEALEKQIQASGGKARTFACDVTKSAEVAACVKQAVTDFGRIDILVNNAGIAIAGAAHEMPVDLWDRVIAVHLRGTFLVTRAVLPQMYARGYGRIINTASQLAYKGAAAFSAYTAAKGGILSFTRSVALEVGARDITINCVAPGATRTPILADVPAAMLEDIRKAIPLGRLADVEDIVPSYLFLAGKGARHYQGQCLSPNGGDVFL